MNILKMMLLSTAAYHAPDDEKGADTRTDAQKQRDSIKVEVSRPTEQEDKKEEVVEKKEEDDKEEAEDEEDDTKEGEEGDDDKEEEKELTAEQKEIAKLKKTIDRLQRRVGKTTGEKNSISQELAEAKKSLTAKVEAGEGLTEEEVERRATLKAKDIAAQGDFEKAQAKLLRDAKKVDPDFQTKVNEMAQDVAPIPPFFIGALEDMDNGGAVLSYLTNNIDEYEEFFQDNLTPVQIIRRLTKISDKLAEEAKPKKKEISKVPAPINSIKGGSESPNVLSDKPNKDKDSMEKFVKQRQAQVEARRKQKLGIA